MGLKGFFRLLREHEIIRRYIIINSFDGALTIFGIILANFIANTSNPSLVILPSIGAAIAMCVSGVWGAYAAEAAEVKKKFKELEKHLLVKLGGSKQYTKSKKITFLVGLVDGFSPLITSFVIIAPFFLSSTGKIGIAAAYHLSLIIVVIILFLLGVFLGRIAGENIVRNGLKMLFAGVIIAFIFYILHMFGILVS